MKKALLWLGVGTLLAALLFYYAWFYVKIFLWHSC